jgi:hypothetical protein
VAGRAADCRRASLQRRRREPRPRSTGSSAPTGTAVPRGQGIAPGAPAPGSYPNAGGGAITPQNVDAIQGNDPRFNTPSYLDALNAAHPEYGGGQAAADALWAKHPEWGTKPTGANTDPYGNVPGFDTGKLQDSTHTNDKYIPSVRTLSQFVGSGGQVDARTPRRPCRLRESARVRERASGG